MKNILHDDGHSLYNFNMNIRFILVNLCLSLTAFILNPNS